MATLAPRRRLSMRPFLDFGGRVAFINWIDVGRHSLAQRGTVQKTARGYADLFRKLQAYNAATEAMAYGAPIILTGFSQHRGSPAALSKLSSRTMRNEITSIGD